MNNMDCCRNFARLFLFGLIGLAAGDGRWFMYRLLRNPGLVNDVASSHDQCIGKCKATSGCSAVSWKQSEGICLLSQCNHLDLYKTTGWNTFVLAAPFIENVTAPSPQLEWMLTDTCGNSNLGLLNGPKFNLYTVRYTSSLSVSAGNAVDFSLSSSSYGMTDASSAVNFALGNQSLTVMYWIKFKAMKNTAMLEFMFNSNTRDLIFWLYTGLWFQSDGMTDANYPVVSGVSPFLPAANTWNHVAYSYNGPAGIMELFINFTSIGRKNITLVNLGTWQYVTVATAIGLGCNVNGSLYCIKMLASPLSASGVAALGNSCINGKVRLSSP